PPPTAAPQPPPATPPPPIHSTTGYTSRFAAGVFSVDFGPKLDTGLARQAEETEAEVVAAGKKKRGRNAAGFTATELRNFRTLLIRKRAELLGDVTSMESEALRTEETNLANLTEHMADRGTDNYEQEFTLDLVQKDRELLAEINHALAKIDGKEDPPYGICEGTGQPIKKERLEVQPWARFSVDYARKLERSGR
ncbi:MAG: TraR/DksA C4-type zinc finger protein, partial [Planctomycetota bacterium]